MDAQHTKHVTDTLGYHFVWCPTYRKRILVGKIATCIEREIRRLCAEQNWTSGALNIQPDHVHLFLSAPSTVAPSEIAHQLKFQRFPEIKNQVWGGAFWSRSYDVGSVGDMSLDVGRLVI